MTPRQVIDFYGGTQTLAANAIGRQQSVISQWLKAGRVPYCAQAVIEHKTRGRLKASFEDALIEYRGRSLRGRASRKR